MMNAEYYTAKDIMKICNVGRTRAYEIIRALNESLEKRGYIIVKAGQVQRSYANERLMIKGGSLDG